MMNQAPERKVSYSVDVSDWRVDEMVGYDPKAVMAELLTIAEELHQARALVKGTMRDLADQEEQLERREMYFLEAVKEGGDEELCNRLFRGGTKDERAAQQRYYLDSLEEV